MRRPRNGSLDDLEPRSGAGERYDAERPVNAEEAVGRGYDEAGLEVPQAVAVEAGPGRELAERRSEPQASPGLSPAPGMEEPEREGREPFSLG